MKREIMILLDFSQTMIGTFMAMGKGSVVVEEDLLRHTVLNTIRQYKHTHRHIYDTGGLVICCDSYKNWRKESFPEYKANRKKRRAQDRLDQRTFTDFVVGKGGLTYKGVTYEEGDTFRFTNKKGKTKIFN